MRVVLSRCASSSSMSDSVRDTFHNRIASVMESLLRAAVLEICSIFEGCLRESQVQLDRGRREIDTLRRALATGPSGEISCSLLTPDHLAGEGEAPTVISRVKYEAPEEGRGPSLEPVKPEPEPTLDVVYRLHGFQTAGEETGENTTLIPICGSQKVKGQPARNDDSNLEVGNTGLLQYDASCQVAPGGTAREFMDPQLRTGPKNKAYSCSFCLKGFQKPSELKVHTRVHTGERPYACAQCGRRFTKTGNLRAHQRQVHQGRRPFPCPECGKHFTKRGNLRTHLQQVHLRRRLVPCIQCGKGFLSQIDLKTHQCIQ